jgi:hypothetical protein
MADNMHRDAKTGRFARRPVQDVDAESRFNPMGDDIPFYDASGAASPSTIPRGRYAPSNDDLAQGGQGSPLRARNPELVHPDDEGFHNAVMRTAARISQRPDDPTGYLVGLNWSGTPATGVRQVSDGC